VPLNIRLRTFFCAYGVHPAIVFLVTFLFLNTSFSFGQNDSLKVDYDKSTIEIKEITREDIEKYKNDPKFDYEIVKTDNPSWWDNFKTWINNLFLQFFEWLFGVEEAAGALALFLRILPYLLLAILLFLLIKFFLSVNARVPIDTNQNQAYVSLSEEEYIIKNEDIQKLIQKALSEKNYRLAVRYYYLYILQLLSEKEIIDWQLQKTNHDYQKEITKPNIKKAFAKITRIYDYIWYGDFGIDEQQYEKAAIVFSTLQNTLKNG